MRKKGFNMSSSVSEAMDSRQLANPVRIVRNLQFRPDNAGPGYLMWDILTEARYYQVQIHRPDTTEATQFYNTVGVDFRLRALSPGKWAAHVRAVGKNSATGAWSAVQEFTIS